MSCAVRFWVEPSEKRPVAVKAWVSPLATDGLGGAIEIDVKVALVTTTERVAATPFIDADSMAVPGATPLTRPAALPDAATVSTVASDELQTTLEVRSFVVPSE